jgi:Co/Zn/Cd efflux system component
VVIDAPALRARKPESGWTTPIDLQTMSRYQSIYWRAWILSLLIMLIELAGSIVSGSFALRADVWHMAGDMLVAFAPLAATYAPGRRLDPQKIVLAGGAAVGVVLTHVGFHFHVRMDFLKNLALPVLGALLALQLVSPRADSWAAGCIGAWIAARGVVLLARSALTFRRGKRDTAAA